MLFLAAVRTTNISFVEESTTETIEALPLDKLGNHYFNVGEELFLKEVKPLSQNAIRNKRDALIKELAYVIEHSKETTNNIKAVEEKDPTWSYLVSLKLSLTETDKKCIDITNRIEVYNKYIIELPTD